MRDDDIPEVGLLPCPFCGNTDIRMEVGDMWSRFECYFKDGCSAKGPGENYTKPGSRAWNKRAK